MKKNKRPPWVHDWGSFIFIIALVVMYNAVYRLSTSNDFPGLGINCLLMEEQGLVYTVNNNWGFAHPLMLYGLTLLTDDLLVSQRILCGIFTLLAFVFLQKLLFDRLGLPKNFFTRLCLWVLAATHLFFELATYPHLDILPIALLMICLYYLPGRNFIHSLWLGFLLGIGFWFRFHFLSFSVLLPFLGFWLAGRSRWKAGLGLAVGTAVSVAVPFVVSKFFLGIWSMANQKSVLQERSALGEYFDCGAQQLALTRNYGDLIAQLDFFEIIQNFIFDLTYHPNIFLPILVFLSIAMMQTQRWQWRYPFWVPKDQQVGEALVICFYLLAAVLPFVLLRTGTNRLFAAYFIPAVPYFIFLVYPHRRVYSGILLVMLVFFIMRMVTGQFQHYKVYARNKSLTQLALQYIPNDVLREHPEQVLATDEFYNPLNRYYLVNPIIMHGWECRNAYFVKFFGQMNVKEMEQMNFKGKYKYLVIPYERIKLGLHGYYFSDKNVKKQCKLLKENTFGAIYECN